MSCVIWEGVGGATSKNETIPSQSYSPSDICVCVCAIIGFVGARGGKATHSLKSYEYRLSSARPNSGADANAKSFSLRIVFLCLFFCPFPVA